MRCTKRQEASDRPQREVTKEEKQKRKVTCPNSSVLDRFEKGVVPYQKTNKNMEG